MPLAGEAAIRHSLRRGLCPHEREVACCTLLSGVRISGMITGLRPNGDFQWDGAFIVSRVSVSFLP